MRRFGLGWHGLSRGVLSDPDFAARAGSVTLSVMSIRPRPAAILSALALIFLVLLHSGRGGGLSDMFGGGLGASAAGSTVVEKNLDRITVVFAVIFIFSSVALALLIDK